MKDDENPQFPNLFVETVQPTVASIMIFAMADLRRIARETDDLNGSGATKVLNLPMSGRDMLQICNDNMQIMKTKVRSNVYTTVEYLVTEFIKEHANAAALEIDHVTIHHFGDDNPLNECVHGILTNSKKKQITLTFRGSMTMQDWITDAKLVTGDVANPLYTEGDDNNEQPEYLGVHLGFRDYLYDVSDPLLPRIREIRAVLEREFFRAIGEDTSNKDMSNEANSLSINIASTEKDAPSTTKDVSSKKSTSTKEGESFDETTKKSKIDVILDQVQEVLDLYPDYKLYITGHSLGGALALLTSVEASVRFATPEIPVTCVTIANPRVGDNRFRGAIQALERAKKLRCATVHNFLDLVPSMPNRICRGDFCRPNKFCMPGIQLILKKHSFTTTYHSEINDTKLEEFQDEFRRMLIVLFCCCRMAQQHNYRTYLDRLVAQKEILSKLFLNDLYKEQGIDFD